MQKPRVAIFGAGIAGLTTAHELIKLGFQVTVWETNATAGGFFRSARVPGDHNMPSEYSWHGFGPFYHNTFELFKEIAFDESASLYEKALSRPIDFGMFPDKGEAAFYDRGWRSIPKMFRLTRLDFVKASWLMLKTWTSGQRSQKLYSTQNASEAWQAVLSPRAGRTWRSCFGPWVGSDWTKVSRHQVGHFFRNQLTTQPPHWHPADATGPAWKQGAGDGWLLLRGPSNEFWFDRWLKQLCGQGLQIHYGVSLREFEYDGQRIQGARLESGERIEADFYVLATNPFAAADILERTPELQRLEPFCRFKPLVSDGPHTQISFRMAFTEPIVLPRPRTAVVLADTEFNITLFAEEQVWKKSVDLGDGVRSLWTGTTCTGGVPGRLFGLTVGQCSKEQYIEEVKAQVFACQSLDKMIRQANQDRGLNDFALERFEVWHEWDFEGREVTPRQPKWVNSTTTQPYLPSQATPVANLILAGAHTKTDMDLWSIEAAVESGKRAAHLLDPRVTIRPQFLPGWIRFLRRLDDLCFGCGAPQILDILVLLLAATLLILLAS